jgi:hypothetical protein
LPHRDPDTGQFAAHDDPVDANYSDFEFVNYRISTRVLGGINAEIGTEYQIETDVLDLENDELAMLTYLNASLSIGFEGPPEEQETRGGAGVNVEIGANLADSEFLSLATENSGIQEVDSETEVNSFAQRATDEAGYWAHLSATANSAFKDNDAAGDPYSGGASVDNDRMRRIYGEETVNGPYIDQTDDISISQYVDRYDVTTPLRTFIFGQMAFLVFEYENRRAEFAPYDPS